jgi:outer membrane biosynthesis protein TonB
MRKFILIAAVAFVCTTSAQAGDSRNLSPAGIDEKLPAALGKAAEPPRVVEAPKPPDPPKPPDTPKAAETTPAESAKPVDTPKTDQPPAFVVRPAAVGTKAEPNKAGQVTFEDNKPVAEKNKPAAEKSAPAVEKDQKTAKADKPRGKRVYWNEARIMRELYRYGAIAGGW